jgi:hypothetical protein
MYTGNVLEEKVKSPIYEQNKIPGVFIFQFITDVKNRRCNDRKDGQKAQCVHPILREHYTQ